MDTQRCQNHGPVRLLVPLLEFNHLSCPILRLLESRLGTAAASNTDERIAFLLPTLYGIYLRFNRF
jgi:hypothetical protein